MSGLRKDKPEGVLRNGWTASVGDYAISGDWACKGSLLVVGDAAGGVYGFEGKSGATRWVHPEAHEGGVLALSVQPGGARIATTGQDGCVRIWRAEDGEELHKAEVGKGWVELVAWSSDGQYLAVSISRRVVVFDSEYQEIWRSEDHPSTVSALAFAGSEELATACYGRVSFFSRDSGELVEKLEWKGSLVSMVLSSDGNVVACGSQDNSVHFWRRSTGEDSYMQGYPGKPAALAFDDSGTLLATGGGESVTVWSFDGEGPEGTTPGVLKLHVQPITKLSFSPRSRRLASGARDGAVIVWSLARDGHGSVSGVGVVDDVIAGVAWRPDGRGLAALDASGGVTVWRVGI